MQIIFGMYTPEQQQPDRNLGRSIKPGCRNFSESDRAFGVPSIRTDVRAPRTKSIASTQVCLVFAVMLSCFCFVLFCSRVL